MTFAYILRVLALRWRIIALCGAIGLVLSVAWAELTPRRYIAAAQVIVSVKGPDTLGTQTTVEQLSPDFLATQIDVLRSVRIARIVVQRLGLVANSQLIEQLGWNGEGSLEDFLAGQLAQGLAVSVANADTRVISVGYNADSGNAAAMFANAFARAYVDTSLDLQAQPARDSALWYQRRANDVQRQLGDAQRRLTERQRDLGVTSDMGQPGEEDARLEALAGQLAQAQAQSAVAGARGTADLPGTLANPVIQTLQSEIAKLEGQRQQLAQTAGPNNPDYRQLVGQLAGLRTQLASQQREVQQGSQVAARQSAGTVSQLTTALGQQKQRVIESRARRDEVAVLQQDVKNLQTVYDQMAARRSQLDLQGESTQSNVSILSLATPPVTPAWPRKGMMISLGLLFSVVLAAGVVVMREIIDQRLRSGEDFEQWLGIPNLGAIHLEAPRVAGLLGQARRLLPGGRAARLPFAGGGEG